MSELGSNVCEQTNLPTTGMKPQNPFSQKSLFPSTILLPHSSDRRELVDAFWPLEHTQFCTCMSFRNHFNHIIQLYLEGHFKSLHSHQCRFSGRMFPVSISGLSRNSARFAKLLIPSNFISSFSATHFIGVWTAIV